MGGRMNEVIPLQAGDAMLVIDVQNDFLPGGSLAVPHGEEVIPVLNRYLYKFEGMHLPVFASRDWHPDKHCSFREQGGPWPPHCVANTQGAEFAMSLQLPLGTTYISKATTAEADAYSAFEGTDLDRQLRELGIKRLFAGGLATDYCVLNTVRDALRLGYRVYVLDDAIRPVEVNKGDGEKARQEMRRYGAQLISSEQTGS